MYNTQKLHRMYKNSVFIIYFYKLFYYSDSIHLIMGGDRMRLDELDKDILRITMKDSRLSTRKIAEKVNASHSTIQYRLNVMMEEGLLSRYSVSLDLSKISGTHLFFAIKIPAEKIKTVKEILFSCPNVIQIFETNGEYQYIAEFYSPTNDEVAAFTDALEGNCFFKYMTIKSLCKKDQIPL